MSSRSSGSYAAALGVATMSLTVPTFAHAAPTTSLDNPLVPAIECDSCHTYPNDDPNAQEPLYAPTVGWQGSLMANAARDPVFWAGVALASQDQVEPNETEDCIRCHSPNAFLSGRGSAIAMEELEPADLDGVTCELCHRMVDDPEVEPGNARYTLDDTLVGQTVARRGPFDYTDTIPPPPHAFAADPYTGSSELCGTCHDVTTHRERVDDQGNPMGMDFNEQRTYSEWAGSAFAEEGADFRSCQDCHMPPVQNMAGCQQHRNVYLHATGGRRHDLVGANIGMLEILRSEYGDSGSALIDDAIFDIAIDRARELLATAATLEVSAMPASVDLAQGLSGLELTVTNESGHKLPTGYSEGRVMWVELVVTYRDQEVYTSGKWDPRTSSFETDDQLRTYEGIAEDIADGTTFHLLRNNHWVLDTRIPPRGLTPNPQTDPVGDRYALQDDGTWPHFDIFGYAFEPRDDVFDATPDDAQDDELQVSARLLYLINSPEYLQVLVDDNQTNDAGVFASMLFDEAGGPQPLELARAEVTVPISGFPEPSDDSGTSGDDGKASTGTPPTTDGGAEDSTTGTPGTTAETDTEGAGAGGGGGGCGCSNTSSSPLPVAAMLSLLLLGGVRRRRR